MLFSNILFVTALLLMSLFIRKLSKKSKPVQRKFFTLSSYFLTGWVFFDFITANASTIQVINASYALSMLCISAMVGFFYLTSVSFTSTLKNSDYFIAITPLIINIPRTIFQLIINVNGFHQIVYNYLDSIWMLSCIIITTLGVYRLLRVSSMLQNQELKSKMRKLSVILLLITIISPISTMVLNSIRIVDITSVISSFLFLLNYNLFK